MGVAISHDGRYLRIIEVELSVGCRENAVRGQWEHPR